jgi:hypothetical protein
LLMVLSFSSLVNCLRRDEAPTRAGVPEINDDMAYI